MTAATPRIMFYVQHLLGIGHLARASRIATALKHRGAQVTLVTGGMAVAGFPPAGLDHVALPPLRAGEGFAGLCDAEGALVGQDWLDRRRDQLLATFADLAPDVVVTEAFPFGRRQMRFELLPLLEAVAARRPRPLLCCSLRDILQERAKPGRDTETVRLVLDHYDRVLVHGDPALARLEDSFPLAAEISDRVMHTGLVAPGPVPPAAQGFDIVVSAGGGAVGEGLALAALDAASLLPPDLRSCIIAGPNMPAEAMAGLAARAARLPGRVTLERFRPDFPALLAASRLSVSQAGYNTVCDVLRAGCRAILVPYAAGGETEQTTRARLLKARGWAGMLPEESLSGPALAGMIRDSLAAPQVPRAGADLDGAGKSADILIQLAASLDSDCLP